MSNRKILFFAFTVFSFSCSFGQITLDKMFQKVLEADKIDSTFTFDQSTKKNGFAETNLVYLGFIKNKKANMYKIVTRAFIWGPNKHNSGGIYIFNSENKYVGQYSLGDANQLPTKLQNGILSFYNKGNSCDKSLKTEINLRHGLPKAIFIKCNGLLGDLYSFSNRE